MKQTPFNTVLMQLCFLCKHPSLVTRGPKLYKVWKKKLIILPVVHHWQNSAASTTWDKSVLTSIVTSNQLCNSNKKKTNPTHIPHFAVSFCLSVNCSLRISRCVHARGGEGETKDEVMAVRARLDGLGTPWSSGRYPCPWQRGMDMSFRIPSSPNQTAYLGITWICHMQWSWPRKLVELKVLVYGKNLIIWRT